MPFLRSLVRSKQQISYFVCGYHLTMKLPKPLFQSYQTTITQNTISFFLLFLEIRFGCKENSFLFCHSLFSYHSFSAAFLNYRKMSSTVYKERTNIRKV